MYDIEKAGQKMSSLEVAELTGKKHGNVTRDIKSLIKQEAINRLSFELVNYEDKKGEMRPMFNLDYESTLILITGYNAKLRSKVVHRWVELEKKEADLAIAAPQTLLEALKLAVELESKKVLLEQKIEADKPHVEFAKAVEDASGAIAIGDFAKVLNNAGVDTGKIRLFRWLRENKYLMENNRPYQVHVNSKYFVVDERVRDSNEGKVVYFVTMITGKGQIAITKKLS